MAAHPIAIRILAALAVLAAVIPRAASAQHITIDGRFSPAQTLVGPNYTIGANLGKQVGGNLFHSFGQFSLSNAPVPERATFTSTGSTGSISNVIGRVTGGNQSNINGAIVSTMPGANLFLINPSGIVLGPNATVNVSGSFHATSADYLKMSDGAKFQATNPDGSTLSAAPPAAFGFLTATPAQISVNGSTLGPVPGTFGLVGGPVSITGGALSAPAGTINVTSAAGTGEVPVDPRNTPALTATSFGPVGINGSSKLDVSNPSGLGSGGSVFIRSGALTVSASQILSTNSSTSPGGSITITTSGDLMLSGNNSAITASTLGNGAGGGVTISAGGVVNLSGGAQIASTASGAGNAGSVTVNAAQITVTTGAEISSTTTGSGAGGSITVTTPGALVLDGTGVANTLIAAFTKGSRSGPSGVVTIGADTLTVVSGAGIASQTSGGGRSGDVAVSVASDATLSGNGIGGVSRITATALEGATGQAGQVKLSAGGAIVLSDRARVTSSTAGSGNAGTVQVSSQGLLSLNGAGTQIIALASATSSGNAGSVTVTAPQILLADGAEIASTTTGLGAGGAVNLATSGSLVLSGAGDINTRITASSNDPQSGPGGTVRVAANSLTIRGMARIASTTFGRFNAGDVTVSIADDVTLSGDGGVSAISTTAQPGSRGQAGQVKLTAGGAITLLDGARVTSSTAGSGNAGLVQVSSQGPLSASGMGTQIIALASATASGNAGSVTVTAPQIAVMEGAEISSTTTGTGVGGSVSVTTPGALVLDGMGVSGTQIATSATGARSGASGAVTVQAGSLSVQGGAQIASKAGGLGNGGNVGVTIAGDVSLSGMAVDGTPSGISAAATQGAIGGAGQATLVAGGALSMFGGAEISSATAGQGNGGTVTVSSQGPLSLSGGGGILALASATASGNAGSVTVTAPQISLTGGAEIASTTAGTGAGGAITVVTPGALALNGGAEIAASATGPNSGSGGSVAVSTNNLIVQGGAQIASSTAGPGKGGDVDITVASGIVLPDPGPQITARSTGSGDAGSVTVSAFRLLLGNGAAISTEAESSTANGGNITLKVADFLYLLSSKISTSVIGATGNGGNITIDPQFVVIDHSQIIAQAIEGHGGDITIDAGEYLKSADSLVSASSALGISGTIEIIGPRVDLNGALVVLPSELRSAAQVLRNSCAAQIGRPQSSLVEAGRGGLPQDPDATLPALYIAGRDMGPVSPTLAGSPQPAHTKQTTARLTMHCD